MPAKKPVNVSTSNEFHEWQRENLPGHFIIQDIDTWVVCLSNSKQQYEPICIIELKRSYIDPESWKPFSQDKPNYIALKRLCDRARLPLVVLYFKKGEKITDSSKFSLFLIEDVADTDDPDKWIKYKRKVVTALEFKENFPKVLLEF